MDDGNSKITVLIVEDHVVTGEGLAAALGNDPQIHVVGTARDARSGLSLAAAFRPAIIVLDLHLPGEQPKALVEAFCRSGSAKIVVFSGETRPAIIEAVMDSGASAYVPKSESAATLASSIKAVTAGHKAP